MRRDVQALVESGVFKKYMAEWL
ncbi:hypothetical protein ACEQPO_15635 [Bacillus sp. SL00103]